MDENLQAQNQEITPDGSEEMLRLKREIALNEQKAARYGTIGRVLCAVMIILVCIAFGFTSLALKIVAVVVGVTVVVAYIIGAYLWNKKLQGMRDRVKEPYAETKLFASLKADFDTDRMKRFSDRIVGVQVRAFRDDFTLEVEFTLKDKTEISAIFDNDRVKLLINGHEESAYVLEYGVCSDTEEVYDALTAQIRHLVQSLTKGE